MMAHPALDHAQIKYPHERVVAGWERGVDEMDQCVDIQEAILMQATLCQEFKHGALFPFVDPAAEADKPALASAVEDEIWEPIGKGSSCDGAIPASLYPHPRWHAQAGLDHRLGQ